MSETLTRIDPTKPSGPVAYTADVRANFQAAQDQIDALEAQAGVPGPPGPQGPPGADSTVPGPPGPSMVSTDPNNFATLGTDSFIYVPPALPLAGGTLTGPLTIGGPADNALTIMPGADPTTDPVELRVSTTYSAAARLNFTNCSRYAIEPGNINANTALSVRSGIGAANTAAVIALYRTAGGAGFYTQNGGGMILCSFNDSGARQTFWAALSDTLADFFIPVQLPADPTSAMQAATKQYVDAAVAPLLAQIAALEARLT